MKFSEAVAREHRFPQWLGHGGVLQGWTLAERGQSEEGVNQIRQGLATRQATGAGLNQSYYLALLAEAYGKAGQAEEGLATLTEALRVVDHSGERFYEAELYRLRGELTLQAPTASPRSTVAEDAGACFRKAMAVAQQQHAKSLELRATLSLARLWQRQGKRHEARATLSTIYHWFTEGFDTKDLQEAKALLDELEASRS